jgi:hypothetical protein
MDKTTAGQQHSSATVRHLREMAAARVERTSLRGVAREVGMSPTGLKKFLMGTAPYSPTVRRLRRWFLQYAALPAAGITHQHAESALVVLTHDLAPDARRDASVCLLECLSRAYEASGRAQPAWIVDLRTEHGPQPRR